MNNYEETISFDHVLNDYVDYQIKQVEEMYSKDSGWEVKLISKVPNPDGKTCTITFQITKKLDKSNERRI